MLLSNCGSLDSPKRRLTCVGNSFEIMENAIVDAEAISLAFVLLRETVYISNGLYFCVSVCMYHTVVFVYNFLRYTTYLRIGGFLFGKAACDA